MPSQSRLDPAIWAIGATGFFLPSHHAATTRAPTSPFGGLTWHSSAYGDACRPQRPLKDFDTRWRPDIHGQPLSGPPRMHLLTDEFQMPSRNRQLKLLASHVRVGSFCTFTTISAIFHLDCGSLGHGPALIGKGSRRVSLMDSEMRTTFRRFPPRATVTVGEGDFGRRGSMELT